MWRGACDQRRRRLRTMPAPSDKAAMYWAPTSFRGSRLCRVDEWSDGIVERAIGVEGFAGAFFEEDFVVAEELNYFVGLFWRDEEDFSVTFAPSVCEILRREEDGWGVGEGASEEHRGGAAFNERDIAAEVEGDGRAVGLIAV